MVDRRRAAGRVVDVSAHQGGSEAGRPGTYEAYEDAATSGAQYAEFDIRRTRDQVLVVYHDPRAGQAGSPVPDFGYPVPDLSYAVPGLTKPASDYAVSDLGYADLCEVAGYRVPLVEDVMRLLAGRAAGHLDLKETGYEADAITLALETFGPGNFVATTLDDASIAAIKRDFPQVTTALSLGRDLTDVPRARWAAVRRSELFPLPRVRRCGADWVAVNYKLARFGVVRACQRDGIGVMVWTVDADAMIDEYLAGQRIDVLITNRPRHAAGRRADLAAVRNPGSAPSSESG
jgi:glycerophosphoryl diester phosphodiesterase